ncbi:MAG: AI-2E family transporter [Pseudonocardia sp.]|nr:AI-2E family transporter [Pseudonocardia sp.]
MQVHAQRGILGEAERDPPRTCAPLVPRALRISAALGRRLLVVLAALYVLGMVMAYLPGVVIPLAIALLLAAPLSPAVAWLQAHRVPRSVAATLVMICGLAVLLGVVAFVVVTVAEGLPAPATQLSSSVNAAVSWTSPAGAASPPW